MKEQVQEIRISDLHPFRNHPFQVKDDDAMQALCDSIQEYGVLSPLLARPAGEGYEIVSGHRRRTAAMKRKAGRPSKENLTQVVSNKRTNEELGDLVGESRETIRRYIRLTYLAKPILDLVDQGRIAFSPAVELSYLTKLEQAELWDIMQSEDCTPSLSQSVRLKKFSQKYELSPEKILDIMSEEKANQRERVRIEVSQIRKFFPKGYTARQMEEKIIQLLEANYRKK